MPFLDILYKLMEDKKIKKNPLCKKLDINTNSFVNWENRGTLPSAEVIIKLANYFDVSSDYLLGLDDVANRKEKIPVAELTNIEKECLNAFNNLIPEDKIRFISRMEQRYEDYTPEQKENVS